MHLPDVPQTHLTGSTLRPTNTLSDPVQFQRPRRPQHCFISEGTQAAHGPSYHLQGQLTVQRRTVNSTLRPSSRRSRRVLSKFEIQETIGQALNIDEGEKAYQLCYRLVRLEIGRCLDILPPRLLACAVDPNAFFVTLTNESAFTYRPNLLSLISRLSML